MNFTKMRNAFFAAVEIHVKIICRLDFKTTRENEVTISIFFWSFLLQRVCVCVHMSMLPMVVLTVMVFRRVLSPSLSSFLRLLLFIFHAYYSWRVGRFRSFVHHTSNLIEMREEGVSDSDFLFTTWNNMNWWRHRRVFFFALINIVSENHNKKWT